MKLGKIRYNGTVDSQEEFDMSNTDTQCCTGCMKQCSLEKPKCSFGENLAKEKGIKKEEK